MTQRSNGNSFRPAQQQTFARSPGAEFEGEALGLVRGLDRFEAPAQVRGDQAAMSHGVVPDDSGCLH
jgi:hypothetical protein